MRNQFDDIVTSLRVKRNELREERYEVEERIRTLDEAIKVLSTGPVSPIDEAARRGGVVARTDTLRLLVTRIVPSQSYPRLDEYHVTAYHDPIKNAFVYRCTCPAFKFAKPDAFFGGEKAHCKHIRTELRKSDGMGLSTAAYEALPRLRS